MSSFRNFLQENMRNAPIFDINNIKNCHIILIVIQFAGIATSILEEIMMDFEFLKKLAWPFPRAFFKI